MKRWFAIVPLVVLVGLVALAFTRLSTKDPDASSFRSPERAAPAYVFATEDGKAVSFASYGEPVIVNFWATWCTPCRAEHPVLLQMKEQGAHMIGILYKDDTAAGVDLLEHDGNPFDILALDPTGDGGIEFGLSGVPETFLVDANGRIVETLRSPLNYDTAQRFLDAYQALAAAPGAPATSAN